MTTAERARHLAKAAAGFPALGNITARGLLDHVAAELGHREILDDFQPVGDIRARAIAPRRLLHIISGNTPLAGLQSLLRGLLLGAHNLCKIPSTGLPELDIFRDALPAALAKRLEISPSLSDDWIQSADAVIVFGSDDTVHALRSRVRPSQIFMAHGHRISFAILYESPAGEIIARAARDISLFDQHGCLSPHCLYVAGAPSIARSVAENLAAEMERYRERDPRGPLPPESLAAIADLRSAYDYRAANDPRVALWCSHDSTAWTVIFEEDPQFAVSPLGRTVFVKPLPENLAPHLALVRPHLGSVAIWPMRSPYLEHATATGAHRVCELGRAQEPSLHWHQDGMETLAPLVTWVDIG